MIPLKKSLMLALGLVVLAAAVILTTTATVGASVQGLPFGGGLFFHKAANISQLQPLVEPHDMQR
jgi:hypothetical protein